MKTIAESFDDQYVIDPLTGCFLWRRAKDSDGYGHFKLNGKWMKAHRYAYERKYGAMPAGSLGCHSCDTPSCVNPDHVWPGSNGANMKDAYDKGRAAPPVLTGEAHGKAILSEEKVASIRARLAAGERQVDVARAFGISPELTYRVKKRIIWKHV